MTLLHKFSESAKIEAGVDEVARGCLFGPVYASAVILDENIPIHQWLNDSKKVTKKRRAVVREWIESTALAWSVTSVDNTEIDRINIKNCTFAAMETAIKGLSIVPDLVVIDGDTFTGNIPCPFVTVVGGDGKYANIAAASILAKEHHDDYIKKLVAEDQAFNRYHLSTNVGYGSAAHIAALKEHGPTPLHRMSFLTRIIPDQLFNLPAVMYEENTTDDPHNLVPPPYEM